MNTKSAIIAVGFINKAGSFEQSRYFETLRAARNWAKFLAGRAFVSEVKMYRGGYGGEPISI